MRGERRNCAAIKLVLFDKGKYGHRHAAPPVWIAQENHVVLIDIGNFCLYCRTRVLRLFLFGLPCQGIIIIGIRRGCLNADYIAANLVVNHIGHFFGIAAFGIIHHERFLFDSGRAVSGCFRAYCRDAGTKWQDGSSGKRQGRCFEEIAAIWNIFFNFHNISPALLL